MSSDTLWKGAGYALTGIGWLGKRGLRRFVLLPLLINSILFGLGIWWAYLKLDALREFIGAWIPDWLLELLDWLLLPLFILCVFIIVFYAFSVVANFIGAPFNGLLAERVAQLDSPTGTVQSSALTWKELLLTPFSEIKKVLYFVAWAIPLLIISLIPVLNMVAPLLWGLFSAWMLALQYADYPLSNRGLTFGQQRQLLRKHWPLTLGFGAVALLFTLIPGLNFLAIPSAVIGATLMWQRETPEGT